MILHSRTAAVIAALGAGGLLCAEGTSLAQLQNVSSKPIVILWTPDPGQESSLADFRVRPQAALSGLSPTRAGDKLMPGEWIEISPKSPQGLQAMALSATQRLSMGTATYQAKLPFVIASEDRSHKVVCVYTAMGWKVENEGWFEYADMGERHDRTEPDLPVIGIQLRRSHEGAHTFKFTGFPLDSKDKSPTLSRTAPSTARPAAAGAATESKADAAQGRGDGKASAAAPSRGDGKTAGTPSGTPSSGSGDTAGSLGPTAVPFINSCRATIDLLFPDDLTAVQGDSNTRVTPDGTRLTGSAGLTWGKDRVRLNHKATLTFSFDFLHCGRFLVAGSHSLRFRAASVGGTHAAEFQYSARCVAGAGGKDREYHAAIRELPRAERRSGAAPVWPALPGASPLTLFTPLETLVFTVN